ncbi:ATP-dependent sacrificial sulfur transferase LarE [Vulgatibacter incomptus]|uniref:GMP synthase glutamine-hydrolyzing protein n=1 Tax=Vulgatibacter incomptus TaxID=1391653 RepID=A0A0K1PE28_9BACT|nr:ATP-dependent sacrificial sulfur transferase LarE [Vulgatibacter incomptus]AKU91747.1 GMP synthase glutamine-hydrolyzing protein [Vulgatibacter incomptus]
MNESEVSALCEASAGKLEKMRGIIRAQPSAIVAFSGGVDSALVLKVALEELGSKAIALTAISPSVAPRERAAAERFAAELGAEHVVVASSEIDDPNYAKNPVDRCYFCKSELYDLCRKVADERGIDAILDGFNADEAGGHRPGRVAGDEHRVISPLLLAGLGKDEIRAWSHRLGLSTWDKPQLACLASRIPYGTEVTEERLGQVARAEEAMQDLGFRIFRVRYHREVARVELGGEELPRLLADAALREAMDRSIKAAGFRFVALDLAPFRTGSLHEGMSRAIPVSLPVLP